MISDLQLLIVGLCKKSVFACLATDVSYLYLQIRLKIGSLKDGSY